MLFGNLLFVIGVPVAIVQLCRSYGGAIGIGPFAGLDTANINAQKGKVIPALNGYPSGSAWVIAHPGLPQNRTCGITSTGSSGHGRCVA